MQIKLAVAGVALLPFQRPVWPPFALAALIAGYLLITASVEMMMGRYTMGLTPFIVAVAFVPVAVLARVVRRWRGRESSPISAEPVASRTDWSPRATD